MTLAELEQDGNTFLNEKDNPFAIIIALNKLKTVDILKEHGFRNSDKIDYIIEGCESYEEVEAKLATL